MSPLPLVLEAAREPDLDELVDLERRCFSNPWNRKQLQDEIAATRAPRILVLRAPLAQMRRIVAFCVLHIVADELHIQDIAVAPGERRRGLARWLLRQVMRVATGRGATQALLEVRRSNVMALGLYVSEGFEMVGVRRSYYRSPVEDALLLSRRTLDQSGNPGRNP